MSGNNGKIWLQKAVKPYRASVVALSIASDLVGANRKIKLLSAGTAISLAFVMVLL